MSPPSSQPLQFTGSRCTGCDTLHPEEALDEAGWCPECRERGERQMKVGPHVVAAAVTLPFGLWILTLEKSAFLPFYAWFLPLAAAYYLGYRIGREAVKAYVRWRRLS